MVNIDTYLDVRDINKCDVCELRDCAVVQRCSFHRIVCGSMREGICFCACTAAYNVAISLSLDLFFPY